MAVLIVASSTLADPGVAMVEQALLSRGEPVVVFDTARFPASVALHCEPGAPLHGELQLEGARIDLAALTSVWLRQPDVGASLPASLDPEVREICRLQGERALASLLECLPVFQLDPWELLAAAPAKPRQLQLARAFGLEVPATLLTNDGAAARRFAARYPRGLVVKAVDSAAVEVRGPGGAVGPLPTRPLGEPALSALAEVELAPMILQERIEKALELRITVVGHELFVAALDPDTAGAVDWREDPGRVSAFRPYEGLPAPVGRRLLALVDRLGLNFATCDLILTPEGRWVFIELNTVSYFDFVERATGLPIAAAIADLLLGLRRRRGRP